MKHNIKSKIAMALIAISLMATGCSNAQTNTTNTSSTSNSTITNKYSDRDLDSSWDENTATKITLSGNKISISGDGAEQKDGNLTIKSAGTYVISGTLDNGKILVEANDTDKVQIVLNNANITNKLGSPIEVKNADKVFLTLADGSTNNITDESEAASSSENTDISDAAIYSKTDLTINGNGSLIVKSKNNEGIKSKDELVITGGNITVDSKEDALTGKDSIAIKGGNFVLNSDKDGLKSSNSTDSSKGWISIDGGTFKITAANDGIDAETTLEINGGKFDITTGEGSNSVSTQNGIGHMREPQGNMEIPNVMTPPDRNNSNKNDTTSRATESIEKESNTNLEQNRQMPQRPSNSFNQQNGQMPQRPDKPFNQQNGQIPQRPNESSKQQDGQITQKTDDSTKEKNQTNLKSPENSTIKNTSTNDSESAKALKSGTNLVINSGEINLDAEEDGIHSNKNIEINGGTINIKAGDDGIHSDDSLTVKESSKISISKSYEGIEAKTINIEGGNTNIVSSDDGLNGTSGSSNSQQMMRGGGETAQDGVSVNISGGTLTINAQGDGVDSNADINISGGQTIVYGPSNGGNGSLDYTGNAKISKGTFVAIGTADMYQGFDNSLSQKSVTFTFSSPQNDNQTLTLVDSNNNVITSFKTQKTYQSLLISSEKFKSGESYTLYKGGTVSDNNSDLSTSGKLSGGEKISQVTISNTNTKVNV